MFVHFLGKGLRRFIIKRLVDSVGAGVAASVLGVSKTAVYRFAIGEIHPSDDVTARALDYLRSRGGADWATVRRVINRELEKVLEEWRLYAGLVEEVA